MTQATQAAGAETLREISERERGERARRAAAGALVLRVVEGGADPFTRRRAAAEVEALGSSPERTILLRALRGIEEAVPPARLSTILVAYACELERTRRLPEADAAVSAALALDDGRATTMLHAARLARRSGARERALALYCAARDLDGGSGAVARLAAVGEAVVSEDAEHRLGAAIRGARTAGDGEAAAVGLEERAAVRREAGKLAAAARDLWAAASRFSDPVDRARAAHGLAGVLLAAGDAEGAREALLAALAWGDEPQREHARSRLHTLSRDLGDRLGVRRWRSFRPPSLVSLSAYPRARAVRSGAERIRQWREAAEAALAG